MQQRIVHRGPDAGGVWISQENQLGLTSRRLSIIDLSDAGNQPMYHQQYNIVICFNGEIYNFKQLKKELELLGHFFASSSDTEVIINAYKAWGHDCLHHLEGMFAFALFDLNNKTALIARDRIGVKPLYFSLQGGILSFASEIKALWVLPWLEKKISDLAWYHYLTFMVSPAPMTIFDGVYKLPAGFCMRIDENKRVSFKQWYSPLKGLSTSEKKEYESESFCLERIKDLLIASTHKRMVADVPVGAFLSGGLDSSLNVALMAHTNQNIKTFTVAFAGDLKNDERAAARRIAQQFNTDHHDIVISEKEAFDFYERMVYHLDEPLADCVCIPFYYVSELARQAGMKVVQVGEGADELFFGYPVYARYAALYNRFFKPSQALIPAFARAGLVKSAHPFVSHHPNRRELLGHWQSKQLPFWGGAVAFGEWQKRVIREFFVKRLPQQDYVISLIYPGMKQTFDSYSVIDYHMQQLKQVDPTADIGKQMLYIELKQRLPELLLMRADKMSMAASIEAREPYLDHHLVEFMMNVPWRLRFKHNQTKYLLKKVAESFLPHDVIYKKKIGFAAPTFSWLDTGMYFPAYFNNLAQGVGSFPSQAVMNGFSAITKKQNKNELHRAVQNWVLQQMWAFTRAG
jgi:asparagine synthase (glutamine-hydrolysing)